MIARSQLKIMIGSQMAASSSMLAIFSMGMALVALTLVIGAMQAGTASLLGLLREMVAVVLAQLGRLLLIGLCLLCLVVVLIAQIQGPGSG
jgi:hypothetical protein